jgi:membrane-bound lytic murein transglycosylase B
MIRRLIIFFLFISATLDLNAKNYLLIPEVQSFINSLHKDKNISKEYLNNLFKEVEYQQTALSFYSDKVKPLPPKKSEAKKCKSSRCLETGSWDRYSFNILKASRIKRGKAYMKKYKNTLSRAYKKFGVPPQYVTAIIGIESYYGANTGKYPVFDTLSTLAFEPNRRNGFFKKELKAFLIMTHKQKVDPKAIKGSYAGAIGLGQFMPSNYKKLAIDFDNNGKISLNTNSDAIGSIAYYLKKSGWKKGQDVAIPVSYFHKKYTAKPTGFRYKYKRVQLRELRNKRVTNYRGDVYIIKLQRSKHDELWLGTKNFYVITRYNHSDYYAMAVYQLAQKLVGKDVSQEPNIFEKIVGDSLIKSSEIESFLDSPLKRSKGRKFIIDL